MNDEDNNGVLSNKEIEEIRNLSQWYNNVGFRFDFIPEEKRDYEKAFAFLQRAEKDMKSAELLFKENQFEDAVFHTQQSVEKIGKSILLAAGVCDERELRSKIRHEFVTYLLEKVKNLLSSFTSFSSNKQFEPYIERVERFLQEYFKERRKEDLYFSFSKVESFLGGYNEFSINFFIEVQKIMAFDFSIEINEEMEKSFDIIIEEREKFVGRKIPTKKKETIKNTYKDEIEKTDIRLTLINTITLFILLVAISFLSVNLEKHVSETRYPQKTKYTKDSDIVKICPMMLETVDMIIDDFYYILSLNMPKDVSSQDTGANYES